MDQLSDIAKSICTSPSYLNRTFNIINLKPHIALSHLLNATNYTDAGSPWIWPSEGVDITAVAPGVTNHSLGWDYMTADELSLRLPFRKPLLVDCPISVCAFGISGSYSDMQRYLLYSNLAFSLVATHWKLLRGIAQVWLMTTGLTSFLHLVAIGELQSRSVNMYMDADAMPAVLVTCAGLAAATTWCSLRFPTYSNPNFSNTTFLFAYYSFYIVLAFLLALVIVFSKSGYDFEHVAPAVLLESTDTYWLTSPCYDTGAAVVASWTGVFAYALRQESELQLITMPTPTSTTAKAILSAGQAALYGISARKVSVGLLVVLIISVVVSALSCVFICRTRSDSRAAPSDDSIEFWFYVHVVFQAAPVCIGFLCFAVAFEIGVHQRDDVLRGEMPSQFGQWGPWVVTVLVAFSTLFAQIFATEPDVPFSSQNMHASWYKLQTWAPRTRRRALPNF